MTPRGRHHVELDEHHGGRQDSVQTVEVTFCIDLNCMRIECQHRIKGTSTNMCGNTNIDDTSEHVLKNTLWVINGYTTVLEN